MGKQRILLWICLLLGGHPLYAQRNGQMVTLSGELRNLYDLSLLPKYRSHTILEEVSSYDRSGGNDDGFNGTYSFVRRNPDSSLVMADIKGCGVINRIWTPIPRIASVTADTLDFYIDGKTVPALSIKYDDLFSGKVFPFVPPLCAEQAGGCYCYFPILFQKSCRIVCKGKALQFHQIQYRLFPEGTRVKAFSLPLSVQEKTDLAQVKKLWAVSGLRPASFFKAGGRRVKTAQASVDLRGKQRVRLFDRSIGGRILGMEWNAASVPDDLRLLITWDGERKPAVNCPLKDFFGYAFGKPGMHSLLLGTDSLRGQNYCYLPMPFSTGARLELVGGNDTDRFRGSFKIFYSDQKRDDQTEGKFYACYRKNELGKTDPPHVFLKANGRGHYVGTILQAQGYSPGETPFFEGDDSTATDGVFRMHGTGSEDYFNGGWYQIQGRWDQRRSLPISGCLLYDGPLSRTGGYRFFLSDKIPFEKSIFHSIEHGLSSSVSRHEVIRVLYTSVAFYYDSSG